MLRLTTVVARNWVGPRVALIVPSKQRLCRITGRMDLAGRRSLPSSGASPGPIPNAALTHRALHDLPALSQVAKELTTDGPGAERPSKLLFGALECILEHYWGRCPTAVRAMELLGSMQPEGAPIFFDHFAFRTFGVEGMGITSLSAALEDLGYIEHEDRLVFETKKLQARWYAPPEVAGADHVLPRVFVSELEVGKLSPEAQRIISKYTDHQIVQQAAKHGLLASATNSLPWQTPSLQDFEALAEESEYAAWVLVNGYALNHTTLTVHRFQNDAKTISDWNSIVKEKGIALNSSGGEEKVSPDGGLRQSSTLADTVPFQFSCGSSKKVPGPYVEFAERRVLPEYQHLKPDEVFERHRREGFEAASADKIFESTSSTQKQP